MVRRMRRGAAPRGAPLCPLGTQIAQRWSMISQRVKGYTCQYQSTLSNFTFIYSYTKMLKRADWAFVHGKEGGESESETSGDSGEFGAFATTRMQL